MIIRPWRPRMTRPRRWVAFIALQVVLLLGVPVWSLSGCEPGRTVRMQMAAQGSGSTKVSAVAVEPLAPRENLIWCATMQMAWNELKHLVGGPVNLEPDCPLAHELNAQSFQGDWVDPRNSVAIADFVRNDVYGRIRCELLAKATLGDAVKYGPPGHARAPGDIVAYAYLQADLKFATPFEKLSKELAFDGTPVRAFGVGWEETHGEEQLLKQVWVHAFEHNTDFVVELQSKNPGERLILAKVPPGSTLQATIDAVERRLRPIPKERDPNSLTDRERDDVRDCWGRPGDVLIVPCVSFDLEREFDELVGRRLMNPPPEADTVLGVAEAVQKITFNMDESGVKLRSSASIELVCAAHGRPGRALIFDGPFLILMQRESAPQPYFAAWIGNTDLLQPIEQPTSQPG